MTQNTDKSLSRDAAAHIANAFGEWLLKVDDDADIRLFDTSTLPFSKQEIVSALRAWFFDTRDPFDRASIGDRLSFLALCQVGIGREPLKLDTASITTYGQGEISAEHIRDKFPKQRVAMKRMSSADAALEAAFRGEDPFKFGVPLNKKALAFTIKCLAVTPTNIPYDLQNSVWRDLGAYEKMLLDWNNGA